MIIVSNSLVLSAAEAAFPAGTPWIGYENLVNIYNITSITEEDGFPVTNLANTATHLKWIGTGTSGSEYITIQTNSNELIDYVGIAKHNFGSAGIAVSIEGLTSNSPPAWVEIVQPTIPSNDWPIIARFTASAWTHVRIRLQQNGFVPQAAVVYVGKLLVLERSINLNPHVPINYGRRTKIVTGMSETGNFIGRIMLAEYRESKAEFEWFTPDFYRSNIDAFLATAANSPFFWAWSPVEYPLECSYAWLINDAEPQTDPATRRVALTLEMRAVA